MSFNDNSKFAITLVTLVVLVISIITGTLTVYSHNEQNYVESRGLIRDNSEAIKDLVLTLDTKYTVVNSRLDAIETRNWTITQEAENAARNAIANPGIRYADPRNPGQFFYVEPINASAS